MVTEGVTVGVLSAADYPAAIPDLAALLVDAVESGASVSFLHGLDQSRAEAGGVAAQTTSLRACW